MIKLNNVVEVFIPKADNEGNKIENFHIDESVKKMTKLVGGATVYEAKGEWISQVKAEANEQFTSVQDRTMQDDIKIYQWYYEKAGIIHMRYIRRIVKALILDEGQEAVSIKVNGTLYIVEPHDVGEKRGGDLVSTLLAVM